MFFSYFLYTTKISGVEIRVRELGRSLKIERIHPHKFRHTQASMLISNGVDIVSVSKRLGHAKVSTTTDIYSHIMAKADEKAANVIDGLLYQKQA